MSSDNNKTAILIPIFTLYLLVGLASLTIVFHWRHFLYGGSVIINFNIESQFFSSFSTLYICRVLTVKFSLEFLNGVFCYFQILHLKKSFLVLRGSF